MNIVRKMQGCLMQRTKTNWHTLGNTLTGCDTQKLTCALFQPQLLGAVDADFQEKFQMLPGEIEDFLLDRKLARGHSKSRSSTPHDPLSEEDG